MDIKEAKVLWDKGGPVTVVPMSRKETAQEASLPASYGACNIEWTEASDEGRLVLLLAHFVALVVRDKVPVNDVHDAFLAVDQYRESMPPELQ